MSQTTKISLAWELFEKGLPKSHIANNLEVNRETAHLWLLDIQKDPNGLLGFWDKYVNSKKGEKTKRKFDGLLKKQIWRIREENRDCCGQKIKKYLKDEYDTDLSATTIYKVLGEKYQLRTKLGKILSKRNPCP